MSKYDDIATQLQNMNRESEGKHDGVVEEDVVKRAIVYTREDMTMVVSYLSSLNGQMHSLRRTHWIMVVLLALLISQRI